MTTQLVTKNYRLINALNFVNSINNNLYYAFAGTSSPFPNGNIPDIETDMRSAKFTPFQNMLFGKYIKPTDMAYCVNSYPWTSGTVYAQYDDMDPNLSKEQFFVWVTNGSAYYIFKCLYNNNGSPSTVAPNYSDVLATDIVYETSDGYQWKYMYQLAANIYDKFSSTQYIPVVPDTTVTTNAVPGSIDLIVVQSGGSGYNNYYANSFSSNSSVIQLTNNPICQIGSDASRIPNLYTGCYLVITGGTGYSLTNYTNNYKNIISHFSNGSGIYVTVDSPFTTLPDATTTYEISPKVVIQGATDDVVTAAARALVNVSTANSIYQVEILNRGANLIAGNAYVYASPAVGVTNGASLRVISSPTGGHGANVISELYCNTIGISVTFANTESNTVPAFNQYQTIGILANPLFSNVVLSTTTVPSGYIVGENVYQYNGNLVSTGVVTSVQPSYVQITNAFGSFYASNTYPVIGESSNTQTYISGIEISGVNKGFGTFTQYYQYSGSLATGVGFTQNETIHQPSGSPYQPNSTAVFFGNNSDSSTIYATSKFGPIYPQGNIYGDSSGAIFNINTVTPPDLVFGSGSILYLENFTAVTRANIQSETIQLYLSF